MRAKLTLEMENAAFGEDAFLEVARILRELADTVEARGLDDVIARDSNGNRVGILTFTEEG